MNFMEPCDYYDFHIDDRHLIKQITEFVRLYFENPKFDASHDFQHVLRVTKTAVYILEIEQDHRLATNQTLLNPLSVILGALLHDVSDTKYTTAEDGSESIIMDCLINHGVDANYAQTIIELVDGVSFSSEMKNPQQVQKLISHIPELAVVQDADRLDAIGAIGIGRCFTFGGAKAARGLGNSIEHFTQKLLRLESMMKTQTGKTMAVERSRRIREFIFWWEDENGPIVGA